MKELCNVSLSEYTTFHMGGVCKRMLIPESTEELTELYHNNSEYFNYIIGGGSNLLINDDKIFDAVVNLREFNKQMEFNEDGTVWIGASVRLQNAINTINEKCQGGIEYLYSVPGLIGGAIFMNAGRGKTYHQSIADYIISVQVLENGTLKTLSKKECRFDYRSSVFQSMDNCIIVGALFRFNKVSAEESTALKKDRISLCRSKQDHSGYNFGTVFCRANQKIMLLIKLFSNSRQNVHFSKKTNNWLINSGKGKYSEAISQLNKVKKLHKVFGKECQLEVRLWS